MQNGRMKIVKVKSNLGAGAPEFVPLAQQLQELGGHASSRRRVVEDFMILSIGWTMFGPPDFSLFIVVYHDWSTSGPNLSEIYDVWITIDHDISLERWIPIVDDSIRGVECLAPGVHDSSELGITTVASSAGAGEMETREIGETSMATSLCLVRSAMNWSLVTSWSLPFFATVIKALFFGCGWQCVNDFNPLEFGPLGYKPCFFNTFNMGLRL